jgi:PAS domain S-box-containing protein
VSVPPFLSPHSSRERNRLHARKSRLRKKFFVDSLKSNMAHLEEENARLRAFLRDRLRLSAAELEAEIARQRSGGAGGRGGSSKAAAAVAAAAAPAALAPTSAPAAEAAAAPAAAAAAGTDAPLSGAGGGSSEGGGRGAAGAILAGPGQAPSTLLERQDFALVEALSRAQHNFVVSDPNLPDNPIVFASQGFYDLTGYTPEQAIGRNCRFLQGPATDPAAIAVVRRAVAEGVDTAVCLVNYRRDGTPFWNSFFVAPLRGVDGRIVNYVGVQCEVSPKIAAHLVALQMKAMPALLARDPSINMGDAARAYGFALPGSAALPAEGGAGGGAGAASAGAGGVGAAGGPSSASIARRSAGGGAGGPAP